MSNKKTTLEEYCRIKLNITCAFLFLLSSKTNMLMAFPHQNPKHPQSITAFKKPTSPQHSTSTSNKL